ncbi:GxxExxY protein [Adhaeribacter arboris]|uniref:GxxExxY protein n=1 Tax=Adhaeribacter arboris TaxID=2072846 RepID=A0A2T2YDV2_9BACT|nr:GxxExxY protein [Adhaeribacter arboris]PSR53684.1 GxxExxY protein [Adhaeribacter arboris]
MNKEYAYADITRKVIGCARQVHTVLGNGFQEVIYQRSLAIEMQAAGLQFAREIEMLLYYKDQEVGIRRVDFLVENPVLVGLKAVSEITMLHHAQIINYLNAYRLQVGLLVSFGGKSLTYIRFVKTKNLRNLILLILAIILNSPSIYIWVIRKSA